MNILLTVILGGIVGWLGSIVMKTNAQMGMIANVVVGIIGSLLGFGVASWLGIAADNTIVQLLVALVGAIVLIAVLKRSRSSNRADAAISGLRRRRGAAVC
ncbi:MAG TPA: GlsB/YeaQ/YmgE family stress response membrane protein [Thermoanaerobaculia bacterium]|nr:GlsB/YeaQ/YmgE family stress response membrane protein [Thermoanaerobaculia bacterium]